MSRSPAVGDGTAPRSPIAAAADPPVVVTRFVVEHEATGAAVLAEAQARSGLDGAGWAAVRHHQGLWIDRQRVLETPALVPAGAAVRVYAFTGPPEVPTLDPGAVLRDGPDWVAVDKPAWLPMQGTRASARVSLEAEVRRLLGAPGARLLHAVHRLDRETSGVAIFARTRAAAADWHRALRDRAVRKRYRAIVEPAPLEDAFTVEGPLARVLHARHSRFALDPTASDGVPSRSRFEVIARGADQAEVRAWPETGRTHQLRVHLAHVGAPIAGDALYGTGWAPGRPSRLLLHAEALSGVIGGVECAVEAPRPIDFPRGLHHR